MNNESKIDLAEIEKLKTEIKLRYAMAVRDGDELTRGSWGYEEGQVYSHNEAKQIAEALEVLPKLFQVLQILDESISYMKNEESSELVISKPEIEIIKQALSLFKDNQND